MRVFQPSSKFISEIIKLLSWIVQWLLVLQLTGTLLVCEKNSVFFVFVFSFDRKNCSETSDWNFLWSIIWLRIINFQTCQTPVDINYSISFDRAIYCLNLEDKKIISYYHIRYTVRRLSRYVYLYTAHSVYAVCVRSCLYCIVFFSQFFILEKNSKKKHTQF